MAKISRKDGSWNFVEQTGYFYSLSPLDAGQQIRAIASYTDEQGFAELVTTEPVDIPKKLPINLGGAEFSLFGDARPGQVLQAYQSSNDLNGNGVPNYQWQVSSGNDLWITAGSGEFFPVTELDLGKEIRFEANYVDGDGFKESFLSDPQLVQLYILIRVQQVLLSMDYLYLVKNYKFTSSLTILTGMGS